MGKNRGRVIKDTWTKDTWTKPKGVGWRVGGREGWGRVDAIGGKWRQLYLHNNNKI